MAFRNPDRFVVVSLRDEHLLDAFCGVLGPQVERLRRGDRWQLSVARAVELTETRSIAQVEVPSAELLLTMLENNREAIHEVEQVGGAFRVSCILPTP